MEQIPDPVPEIYFGGSSPIAGEIAARHADVYLTWGEPPAAVAEKIAWIRGLAEKEGRRIRFGIRMHTITRDTSEEAWAEADRLLAQMSASAIDDVQAGLARSESEGQRRMMALHGGRTDDLEIHPNVWAGVGLVRGGAGTALVGSHEEVADRIEEYADLGIDEFVLSAYPHLEGAYWFGEGVLPILEERGRWVDPAPRGVAGGAVPHSPAGQVAAS
ncbi:LLM class flavin-dependent oxidoreductase [Nocardioides alcanivorans]|uniref:LLM class flavin-dependent oxidoreductase n=1 Tax=Nocardioides alcanivorans TaxID=2897352 RepID=UPI0035D611C0